MAEITLPTPVQRRWLTRPFLPTWQRLAALTITWETAAYTAIVLVALALRIWDVGARAMHHDESLHAYYAWQFFTGRGYTYDPLTHGPFQFEVVPLFYLIFGASEFSARLLAVVLGTALVGLPYLLRRWLTVPGALLASGMLAISPAFVYFSRFIRDDIYVACFALLLFVCVVRYLESPRPHWLYIGAAAAALSMTAMESAYLTFFIFGTFLIFQGVRERLTQPGPVLRALRSTSLDTWLTGVAIFVIIIVLFYSTFFTNPYGIWDTRYPLLGPIPGHGTFINPSRQDIIGGIGYWMEQHYYARGGQPWYYYLLLLPLYEQLALLFGAAGLVFCALRRSFFRTFLVWWAVMAYAIYTWAGEKMPWLVIHIALPLILLAGLFLGTVLLSRRTWAMLAVALAFVPLLVLEIHSMFALNFVDGANPTEMLIYVQTSQDVPTVSNEIKRLPGWPNVTVGLDDSDVGGWPFQWYLRDDPDITETSTFNGPVCGGQYCQVILMLDPTYSTYGSKLLSHYVVQKYRWNWWFPEDYKVWFPTHWGAFFSGSGSAADLLGTQQDWTHIWDWLMYRTPFGPRDARWMYVLVRRDLVPGAKNFPTRAPGSSGATAPTTAALPWVAAGTFNGGPSPLYGPRGISADRHGNLYVADTLNHRIVEIGPDGKAIRTWGTAGTAPGEFSGRDSPQDVTVGPDGLVYATDTWNQRIEVFSPTGRFIRQWGGGKIGSAPGQFYGPRSIAVSPAGRVYVADTGNKRIQVFSKDGKYLYSWGAAGTQHGQFNEPSSVAVSARGEVYVADYWNQRIQVFDSGGRYVRSWQVPDWTAQSYDEPYLALDPATGNLFATDPQQGQVLEYTPAGRLLGAVGSGTVSLPIGVTVETGERLAVTDPTANTVSLYRYKLGAQPRRHLVRGTPTHGSTPLQP